MKKVIRLVLALVMCASLLPLSARAAGGISITCSEELPKCRNTTDLLDFDRSTNLLSVEKVNYGYAGDGGQTYTVTNNGANDGSYVFVYVDLYSICSIYLPLYYIDYEADPPEVVEVNMQGNYNHVGTFILRDGNSWKSVTRANPVAADGLRDLCKLYPGESVTFTMPVEYDNNIACIYAMNSKTFEIQGLSVRFSEPPTASDIFTDVPADAYYADAVAWALSEGITDGTSADTFSPDRLCTNAHIITFLYRVNGESWYPEFEWMPYTDINEGDYFYDPALWAYAWGRRNSPPHLYRCRASTQI